MTKQHFIAAAKQIKALVDAGNVEGAKIAAQVFAGVALDFNPRFDMKRFLTACGL